MQVNGCNQSVSFPLHSHSFPPAQPQHALVRLRITPYPRHFPGTVQHLTMSHASKRCWRLLHCSTAPAAAGLALHSAHTRKKYRHKTRACRVSNRDFVTDIPDVLLQLYITDTGNEHGYCKLSLTQKDEHPECVHWETTSRKYINFWYHTLNITLTCSAAGDT